MLAEEMIQRLQELIAQHGNLYVENENGEGITIEFNDDEEAVFVAY